MADVDLRDLNAQSVGELDADMWRSYYNHEFFKLFVQLLRLIKLQLGLNWFLTIRLAYYAAWAAADYRIRKHKGVNNARVLRNLSKFYRLIARHSAEPFDYERVAKLELEWWDVHRKSYKNNPKLERALAEAAAALYNVDAARLKEYAHYRAEAMILPRHEGDDSSNQTDWAKVTELTVKAWQVLCLVIQDN